MAEIKLSYGQLRQIMALTINNGEVRTKLGDILNGKGGVIMEADLMDLLINSEVDKDIIRILSGQNPDTMDAIEALEILASFFAYIRASKPRFARWLESIGLKPPAKSGTTGSPALR